MRQRTKKMYSLKKSISAELCYAFDDNMWNAATDAGFFSTELGLCKHWFEDISVQDEYLSRLERGIEKLLARGVDVESVHVPFGKFWDFCAADEEIRAACVRRTVNLAARLRPYGGIKYLVVHTNGVDFPASGNREIGIAALRKSLVDLSGEVGLTVCAENLPRTCLGNSAAEMERIISGLPVKVALDTNHIFKDKKGDFIRAMGGRIAVTHVSDDDGTDEKHWLPYDGVTDWNEVVGALERVGYRGTFNYETPNDPSADFARLSAIHDKIFRAYNSIEK